MPSRGEGKNIVRCGLAACALGSLLFCSSALAATAFEFFSSRQNPDGSFGNTAASLATPVQSTAEVLRAYESLGAQSDPAFLPAFGYLNADAEKNTEFLARKIIVDVSAGSDVSVLISTLLANQNPDGGFGDQPGYDSSALDTAYALQALGTVGYSVGAVVPATVGYLLAHQNPAGGWSDGDNDPSIFTTANVVRALTPYRSVYQGVESALANGASFLLSKRTTGGLWSESFETAIALLALDPVADRSLLTNSFAALAAMQQANGSWVDDSYTTALALQALALLNAPTPDPTLGTIRGRVIDGLTGVALVGVAANLTGTASQSVVTDGIGTFQFVNLPSGAYSLTLSLSGYNTVTSQTQINGGQTVDFGTIALTKNATTTTGTVRGVVTDAQTNQPLSAVAISVTGASSVVTDANGAYQVANVPLGAATLTANKVGYAGAIGFTTITAGSIVVFSPSLSALPGDVTLQGRIVEAATGTPLSGVTVNLSGPTASTAITGADGRFSFSGLPGGTYSLTATTPGFFGLTASIAVNPGQYDLGDFGLSSDEPASTGILRGTVTDAQTGTAIAGAAVSAAESNAITDAAGAYLFTGLQPGEVVIQVSSANYVSASAVGSIVAGGTTIFSPVLTPLSAQETALEGTVRDGVTNAPLAGVAIAVSGESSGSATTNAQGNYRITGLNAGVIIAAASLSGYDTVTGTGTIVAGTTTNFSPILFPSGNTPPDANATGVRGVVLDAGTNLPIVATVTATSGAVQQTATTDGTGIFQFTGFDGTAVTLMVSATGYTGATLNFTLEPLKILDIGQVRLVRTEATALLPDLVVTNVDGSQVQSNPQTFAISGLITATIENRGTLNALSATEASAFQDINRNGQFDSGEPIFGVTTVSALDVGQSQTVSIAVSGNTSFRDAPISVFVDSSQIMVESNENNNVGTSASSCQIAPIPIPTGGFQPQLKWAWTGSTVLPQYNQVMSMPLVMPLVDTSGDGKVDQNDIPVVIFHTFAGSNIADGVLRAVSGSDGHELWTVTDPAYHTSGDSSLAAADLDGNGQVTILAPKAGGGLIAFNADGSVRWVAQDAALSKLFPHWGGPTVANLDGNGKPSIIVSNEVLNANGTVRWTASENNFGSFIPVVADLYLDGKQEVILGASAYDHDGQLLWSNPIVGDGFVAVGNFNADPYPELAVVTTGYLWLLDHTGAVIWGPVVIPGSGGAGGPPAIAGFDGSGTPGIGVAGATAYTVFRSDGSLLWSRPIEDRSAATGSSAFDFNGDGQIKVVYNDEQFLRIYRGTDGAVLFQVANSSGTTFELPVVADVDGDGHADIVVGTNNYAWGTNGSGIRVYADANNSWVPTRKIWNQHSYHITNVNDDGTVPRVEPNSWQIHNTYRLNAFPDRSPLATPDLTAGNLRFAAGSGGASLTVTVGNSGAAPSPPDTVVRFYEGDPAAGGRALGDVVLAPLAAGASTEVTLSGVTNLVGSTDLFAVVDATNRVTECREDNNSISVPGPALIPDLIVSTVDVAEATTDPQTLAVTGSLTAEIDNQGTLTAPAGAEVLAFYDINGNMTYDVAADVALGRANLSTSIGAAGRASVQIALQGQAPFRDAPISVFVDSTQIVIESNEVNNVGSAASACAAPIGCIQPPTGMVGWWSGDNHADDLMNGNPGMLVGGVAYVPGYVEQAFSFDGIDGAVRVPETGANLDGFSQLTIDAWINPTTTAGSQAIVTKYDSTINGASYYLAVENGVLRFVVFQKLWSVEPSPTGCGGAVQDLKFVVVESGASAISANTWTHVTGVWAGGSNLKLYKNGAEIPGAVSVVGGFQSMSDNQAPVNIGRIEKLSCTNHGEPGVFFSGLIDEVEIFNRALTPGEIQGICNAGTAGKCKAAVSPVRADLTASLLRVTDLGTAQGIQLNLRAGSVMSAPTVSPISWWAGEGNANDSADGNQGTLQGGVTFAPGKVGTAFSFDGVDDGVNILKTGNLNMGPNDFSIEAWVKMDQAKPGFVFLNYAGVPYYGLHVSSEAKAGITFRPGDALVRTNNDPLPEATAIGTTRLDDGQWHHLVGVRSGVTALIYVDGVLEAATSNPDVLTVLGGSVNTGGCSYARIGAIHTGPGHCTSPTASPSEDHLQGLIDEVKIYSRALSSTEVRALYGGGIPPVQVAFYDGDPAAGGVLLGTTTVTDIPAVGYKDITFTTTNVPDGTHDIYAVVDSANQIAECREDNNTTHTAVQANIRGAIAVATDKAFYGPNSPALLQGLVTNTGALRASFSAELRVEDATGALVQSFPAQAFPDLNGGASITASNIWNTGTTLVGTYRLHGLLRDAQGALIADAAATFEIRSSETNEPAVTLRVSTDRTTYNVNDLVNIDSLVSNVTVNALIDGAELRLRIKDNAGTTLFTNSSALGQLPPGALRTVLLPYGLNDAPLGLYRIEGEVVNTATGAVLAASSTQYTVINDATKNLTGDVTVASATVEIGTSQLCTYTVTNIGPLALNDITLRMTVADIAGGTAVESATQPVSLAPGATQTIVRTVATDALSPGDYGCALEALIDGTYHALGFATFRAVEPPIRIDAAMTIGTKGRLLVLVDSANQCEGGNPNSCPQDGDPHGPDTAPGLSAQRPFLENLLTQAGWSYTITDDADAFAHELGTGGYAAYLLLSEQVKLSETTQKELREVIFRGEGLVVAGSHDNRNQRLNDALGIKRIGTIAQADSVTIPVGVLGVDGSFSPIPGDRINRIKRTTAQSLGVYELSSADGSPCQDEDPGAPEGDACDGNPAAYLDAVVFNSYGIGKALFAGFDLLAVAAQNGSESLTARTLLAALTLTHPAPLVPTLGGVLPVDLKLTNQGVATPITVTVSVPPAVQVTDAGGGELANTPSGQVITWTRSLAVDEEVTLRFFIRLPMSAATVSLHAAVTAGQGGNVRLAAEADLALTVTPIASLDELAAEADALRVQFPVHDNALTSAASNIGKAVKANSLDKALDFALKATDDLLGISEPEIVNLRRGIDAWLRDTLILLN